MFTSLSDTRGVGNITPFFKTFIVPPFSAINIRPSLVNATAVARERLLATTSDSNPGSRICACACSGTHKADTPVIMTSKAKNSVKKDFTIFLFNNLKVYVLSKFKNAFLFCSKKKVSKPLIVKAIAFATKAEFSFRKNS